VILENINTPPDYEIARVKTTAWKMDQITNESASSRNYGDYSLMDPRPGER